MKPQHGYAPTAAVRSCVAPRCMARVIALGNTTSVRAASTDSARLGRAIPDTDSPTSMSHSGTSVFAMRSSIDSSILRETAPDICLCQCHTTLHVPNCSTVLHYATLCSRARFMHGAHEME